MLPATLFFCMLIIEGTVHLFPPPILGCAPSIIRGEYGTPLVAQVSSQTVAVTYSSLPFR
eukprot:scaffold4732_cov100-Skeletonema_marinoi.AAC.6